MLTFYDEPNELLSNIRYTDFWEFPNDDDFPYISACQLLCGSCHHFALSLNKVFNYNPYVIEGINGGGFHIFCQIYKNRNWYYVDARGITSCFNKFMDIAKTFVSDEYIIRPVSSKDIEEWDSGFNYNKEAYEFAEAVIRKFKNHYELDI